MEVTGSIALVTGANRGLGAAIVQALAEAGARRVYAAARRAAPPVAESGRIVPVTLDVTDLRQIAAAAKACGDAQILVNNAGIFLGQSLIGATNPDAAEQEMRVNYLGTLQMARAFAPILRRNGGGAIVNVASILGRVPIPRAGSYAASKAAVVSLTQAIRGELLQQGTLVIGVMPAYVDTDMAAKVSAPKLSPRALAEAIVEAIRAGTEDVYPGIAAEIAAALQRDPKAIERQFASR